MAPRRQIDFEFTRTETGDRRVIADLVAVGQEWPWLLRELGRLSDDKVRQLFVKDDGDQAVGPEGTWGILELDPYLLLAQLEQPDRLKQRYGISKQLLKICRLYRRRDAAEAIEELRRLEQQTARRLRKGRTER